MRWGWVIVLGACEEVGEPTYVAAPDWCDEAPVTTWDNFGRGFLVENCQGCHARASLDRHEAPVDFTFDTPEDVAAQRQAILDIATGIFPQMPPAGGVAAEERARLEAWLTCDFDPLLR
jgi:uncharacterized membrane protein